VSGLDVGAAGRDKGGYGNQRITWRAAVLTAKSLSTLRAHLLDQRVELRQAEPRSVDEEHSPAGALIWCLGQLSEGGTSGR
jgi:hypothetical protein